MTFQFSTLTSNETGFLRGVINLTIAFVSHSCNWLVLFLRSICTVQMVYLKKGRYDVLFWTVLFSHEKLCLQLLLAEFVAVFLDDSQSHHDLIKADCFFKKAALFCFHIMLAWQVKVPWWMLRIMCIEFFSRYATDNSHELKCIFSLYTKWK